MDWYQLQFFGMHLFWWAFWVMLLAVFFTVAVPVRRKTVRELRETPIGILQRRYAAGEITTEEYERRMGRFERDLRDPKLQPFSKAPLDHDASG